MHWPLLDVLAMLGPLACIIVYRKLSNAP